MEQRINLVTLGVADIKRARRFYERLGWEGQEVEETVFFQAGGLALATVTRPPADTFYGGYAGCFADPDGHVWEIAHNPGFPLADDGSISIPDFGSG